MTENILSLREQRNQLIAQARTITDTATKEGSLTNDQQAEIDGLLAQADNLKNQISLAERQDRLNSIEADDKQYTRKANPTFAIGTGKTGGKPTHLDASIAWFKYGKTALSHRENEAVEMFGVDLKNPVLELSIRSEVDTTTAAELRPTDFYAVLQQKLLTKGGVLNAAYQYPTGHGRDVDIPLEDDTSNAAALTAEKAGYSAAIPSLDKVTLKAYKFTSEVGVTEEMLEDSAVNLAEYIASRFANRFDRGVNPYLTTGTGTNQPQGVVTGATATTSTQTAINYDLLVDLEHDIDAGLRAGAKFMGTDKTLAFIKKLLDSSGRPLLQNALESIQTPTGPQVRLLGYEYVINNYMAELGAGSSGSPVKPLLFGAIGSEYWVRKVNGIQFQRLNELGARNGIIYFIAKWRLDGRYVSSNDGVKYWSDAS